MRNSYGALMTGEKEEQYFLRNHFPYLCILGRPRRSMLAPEHHHLLELRVGSGLEGALEPRVVRA